MRASEVIERLKELIDQYGDKPVVTEEENRVHEINLWRIGGTNQAVFEINKELK